MQTHVRTVAISRQRGSGGALVGRTVADRLGFRFVDRDMLRVAAENLGDHGSPAATEPAGSSWWSRISAAFAMGGPDPRCGAPSVESVYEGDLFEIEQRLLREIVDDEPAVIVGRGAAQILRGRPRGVDRVPSRPRALAGQPRARRLPACGPARRAADGD